MTNHLATHLRAGIAFIAALALSVSLFTSAPAAAASPTACRVKNLDTGVTRVSLQKAVRAASAGDRLKVKGTCVGTTRISKRLTIFGVRTATSGKPILDGAKRGAVVTVTNEDVRVTIRDLTIRGGQGSSKAWAWGGGIRNRGTLILGDVMVQGNIGNRGAGVGNYGTLVLNGSSLITRNSTRGADQQSGGVFNGGTLTLNGSSSISRNTGMYGGGIENYATLTLNGSSTIRGNTAKAAFGGVLNQNGTLTLNGSSSIRGNTAAENGGGVANVGPVGDPGGTLVMNDSSSITGNTAGHSGGGVWLENGTLVNVVCAPEANPNVYGNHPDECDIAIEP